jgi:hypothetical protein
MTFDQRKFSRVNIPIITEFRPAKESGEYSWGLTRNFSCEGFGFESLDFQHEPNKTIEFKLKFPQKGTFISVLGDVMWRERVGDKYIAGIKFKEMSDDVRRDFLEKISEYGGIPVERFFIQSNVFRKEQKKQKEFPVDVTGKTIEAPLITTGEPGIARHYLNAGSSCMVTFRLPKEAVPDAEKVTLAGDFNNWDTESIVMKKLKNGDFAVTLKLKAGRAYRFRYLINGERWENDWHADRYDPNPFGWHDSVVIV